MRHLIKKISFALGLWLVINSAYALSYSATDLGISAQWAAINNSGQIVGGGAFFSEVTSYEYSGGSFTTIGSTDRGDNPTYAYGINNAGVVAGTVQTPPGSGLNYGVTYFGGIFSAPISLISAGDASTSFRAINDLGQIAGTISSRSIVNVNEGFLLTGGNVTLIANPNQNSNGTQITGLNNRGEVIGTFESGTSTSSFLYKNGTYTTIFAPDGSNATVTGINNVGDVVGNYFSPTTGRTGFIYNLGTGQYTTVDAPGLSGYLLYGINDRGDVVGSTQGSLFVATVSAVPEPHTYPMFLAGLGLLGFAARHKRQKGA